MLQSIRDNTQGWIAGVIVTLLILSFALWGIHSYIGGGTPNLVVATVNGTEITKNQLSAAYERLRRQVQAQFSANNDVSNQAEFGLKERALQTLINVQVLKQASYSQSYRISNRQIDNYLMNMPEFLVNGQFSETRFNQMLENILYSPNEFLELIQTSLLIDQPRLGVIFTSFALPNEITDTIALINQERKIQYAIVSLQSISQQPIQISDDKVQAYYNQHIDEFKTPEQVSIEYVELSLDQLMKNVHPTDDSLKKFYDENSNSYTSPMQWKLETILIPVAKDASDKDIEQAQNKATQVFQKANAGKSFTDLMQEFSIGKVNEKLVGLVTVNQVPAELQKSALTLKSAGQIAEPVRTSQGFVLLKAIEFKDAVVQPFDQVKEKVKDLFIRQQVEQKFADAREKLASITYEHPESLEPAAKSLGLQIQNSGLFSKDVGGKDISANTKIREAAFSHDVLNSQNNSDIIQTNNDHVIVLRIKTHNPATVLPLKTVENQILNVLKTKEIEDKAAQQADEIKQQLQNGMSPDQIAKKYNLSWIQSDFIGRRSDKINSAVIDSAFAMPRPQSGKPSFTTAKVPDGFAIIQLLDVRDGDVNAKNHEQYQVFAQQLQNTQGLMEYELYKQSLVRQAKVNIEN